MDKDRLGEVDRAYEQAAHAYCTITEQTFDGGYHFGNDYFFLTAGGNQVYRVKRTMHPNTGSLVGLEVKNLGREDFSNPIVHGLIKEAERQAEKRITDRLYPVKEAQGG